MLLFYVPQTNTLTDVCCREKTMVLMFPYCKGTSCMNGTEGKFDVVRRLFISYVE